MKHKALGFALATILAGLSLPAAATVARAQAPTAAATASVTTTPPGDDDDDDDTKACIDATLPGNIRTEWHGTNAVTVSTKDGRKPCAKTRVVFSAYVMPWTWDGKGFNESAFPQKIVRSTKWVVLSKKDKTLELEPVDSRVNVQFDVYYAPHVIEPTWPVAHGEQYISSRFQHARSRKNG